jgi:hypothetical protein
LLVHVARAGRRIAYTGKNDWNSLRDPVQAAGSYAPRGLAPQITGTLIP